MLDLLARLLTRQWAQLLHQRQRVLEQPDIDEIHDLRVTSRRLRSTIEQLQPFLEPEIVNRLKRPVRRLTRELGEIRNLDEALLFFKAAAIPSVEPFMEALKRNRKRRLRQLLRNLDDFDTPKRQRQIAAAATTLQNCDDFSEQALLALFAERSMLLYRPIHELLPLTIALEQDEERHLLRIAVKKWRYLNELLGVLLESPPLPLLELLKRYQGLLGSLHDLQVFKTLAQQHRPHSKKLRAIACTLLESHHEKLLIEYETLIRKHPLQYHFPV